MLPASIVIPLGAKQFVMDTEPALMSARRVAEKLAAEIAPRFGPLHAADAEETFATLWEEHIRLRSEVSRILALWSVDLSITNEEENVFRQCFLRLAGAVELATRHLDGELGGVLLPSTVSSSRHMFEFLVIDSWGTDDWPTEWLRYCSERGGQHFDDREA
jgi:hypothetical protein